MVPRNRLLEWKPRLHYIYSQDKSRIVLKSMLCYGHIPEYSLKILNNKKKKHPKMFHFHHINTQPKSAIKATDT